MQSACSVRSVVPASGTALVRYKRLFASTGDDHPRPGISIFHATCSVALHSTGTFEAAEVPARKPANCGHSVSAPSRDSSDRKQAGAKERLESEGASDKSGLVMQPIYPPASRNSNLHANERTKLGWFGNTTADYADDADF